MPAEPKQLPKTERIVKHLLSTLQPVPINWGFSHDEPNLQAAVKQVSGAEDDPQVQVDIWGTDKETVEDATDEIIFILDSTFSFQTPYGIYHGGDVTFKLFQPDDTLARYVINAFVVAS